MASYIVQGECAEISYQFDIVLSFEMIKTDKENFGTIMRSFVFKALSKQAIVDIARLNAFFVVNFKF